jgi:hypothetical protein
MSPRARRIALSGLLGAAALAAAFVGLTQLARRAFSREAVEARLERLMGRDLRLGSVQLRFGPTPGVRLEDVALAPDVRLGQVEVDLVDGALLEGRIELDEVAVRRAELTLVRAADGSLGVGRPGTGGPAGRGLPALASLEIEDARVTWIDESQPGLAPLRIDLQRLVLEDVAPGRTANVALLARLGDDGRRGEVSLHARLGPLGAGRQLGDAPGSLALVARGLDARIAAAYLPRGWDVRLARAGELDADVELERRAAGDFDARLDVILRAPALGVGPLELAGPARFVGTLARAGGRLSARGTRVEAAEAAAAGLHARDVRGSLSFAAGEITAELQPRSLELLEATLEGVTLSGVVRPGDALELRDGALRAETARRGRFAGQDLTASFRVRGGAVEVAELAFEAYGGRVAQRGRIVPGTPPQLALDLAVEGVDLAALVGQSAEDDPTRLWAKAQVSGRWTGEENWLAPLAGSGTFRAEGGPLYGAVLLPVIARALVDAVPGSGLLRRERPPRRTRLESAQGRFVLRAGRVVIEELVAVTGDYRVRGHGSLGHDGSLDFQGEVALTASGVDQLVGLLGSQRMERAIRPPAIPIRIRGTLAEPRAQANVSSMPRATVRGLVGLPERAADAVIGVGEAGGSAVRGVFDTGRRILGLGRREEPAGSEPDAPPEPPATP